MRKLTPTPLATAQRVLLLLAVPSIFAFMGMSVRRTAFFPEQYFLAENEIAAANWLAENSDRANLILAGNRMGNYLPRLIQGRVFLGHYYTTVDSDRKAELARQFFDADTPDAWRAAFLAEWEISHIYYGYYESQVGPPPDLPGWKVIYNFDNVIIYEKWD